MRALGVVKDEEPVHRPLERPGGAEVVSAKLETPVLMENRPLQAFDKPIGPRMAWFGARMPHLAVCTRRDEAGLELFPVVQDMWT